MERLPEGPQDRRAADTVLTDQVKGGRHEFRTFINSFANIRRSGYLAGLCPLLIGKEGNFVMKLTIGNKVPDRPVEMDFSMCAIPECFPPFNQGLSSGPWNLFSSGVDLAGMVVDDEVFVPLALEIRINLDNDGLGCWNIYYDPSETLCPNSLDAWVARIADDTWEIVGDIACLAEKLEHGVGEVPMGLHVVPFRLTVQVN